MDAGQITKMMSLADMFFFGDVAGLHLIGDVIGCNTFFHFGDVIGVEQFGDCPSICKVIK
jgi:hypothetical protein